MQDMRYHLPVSFHPLKVNCSKLAINYWADIKFPVIDHKHLFTLEGQINHKIQFIKNYVPKGTQLYFIGHSIGSKIVLSLVNKFESDNKTVGYLLFPTCERMAQTPNGRKLWPILGPLRKVVVLGAALLQQLPESWLSRIVHWFMSE